jgi:cystathionine beta-lyase
MAIKYDFDEIVDRKNSFAAKYDELRLKYGKSDIIPMWVADVDFKAPQPVIDAMRERLEHGIFGYTSKPDSYYEAISQWLEKRHDWKVDPKHIIHSPMVVPSLRIIVREFTKPGDKIIIQPPVYPPFFDVVKSNNRELVLNPLKIVDGKYVMDYENLESAAKSGAKMLILCNPHNPIGRVWTREELLKLGEICVRYGIRVVSDEIHSDLIYKGNKHTAFGMISEDFFKNSITCAAPTKTFNIAGLQASYVIFPNEEEKQIFNKAWNFIDITRNNCFGLVATEAAYRQGEEWLEQLLEYLQGNVDLVNDYCKKYISKIKPNRPEGTYLIWIDCRELGMDKDQLTKFMVEEVKVVFNDGYAFGTEGEGYIRMNIACPRSIVQEALDRLKRAIDKL